MKQLVLEVPDNKFHFIMELLKNFRFLKVKTSKKETSKKEILKKEILNGLKEAVEQVNLHKQGKIKLKSLDQLLNEL